MAPKSKRIALWAKCTSCTNEVPQKEMKNHSEGDCPSSRKDWVVPFISTHVLFGFLEEKDIADSASISQENIVFIHQSIINMCNFVIGEPVLIKSSDLPPIVKYVWPSPSESFAVHIYKKGLMPIWKNRTRLKITVERFEICPQIAETIHICCESPITYPDFLKHLHLALTNKIIHCSHSLSFSFFGKSFIFNILSIDKKLGETSDDSEWFLITDDSKWIIQDNSSNLKKANRDSICIGGVDNIICDISSTAKIALEESTDYLKVKFIKSVLLYGPSGTGKSLISKKIASDMNVNTVNVNTSDIYSKFYGETESALKKIFADAIKNHPSLIIIDDIDVLCPKRNSSGSEQEKRIASTLAVLLDNIHESDCKIFILATSSKLEMLDPSLRRYGRIDNEIEIPIPDKDMRFDILSKHLSFIPNSLKVDEIKRISDAAHGFVGADIANLCTQASMSMLKKVNLQKEISVDDFEWALKHVNPSAMREVLIDIPNVKWTDVGGQDDLKLKLKQAIEWPLKHGESFNRLGIKAPSGVLMYGPPGCSKTMIAKAVANESHLNFLSIKGPELFSKWVGESERAVRELFRKARQVAPSIIFFDEIDALGGERSKSGSSSNVHERVLAQLLTEMDGISPLNNVTIIAATNRPDKIDSALLRPGRLDRIIYVPLPDEETRRAIFNLQLSKMPLSKDVLIEDLVVKTEGYSGAEVNAVCHEAALKALEQDINSVEILAEHFKKSLQIIKPRTPVHLLLLYDNFKKCLA